MYDAWTAYNPIAVAVVSGTALKGLGGANKQFFQKEGDLTRSGQSLAGFWPPIRIAKKLIEIPYS